MRRHGAFIPFFGGQGTRMRERLAKTAATVPLALGAVLLSNVYYRAATHPLITERYPEFTTLTLAGYLRLGLSTDTTLIGAVAVILLLFAMLPVSPKWPAALTAVFIGITHILGINFFKVYETTFQKNYIGTEHFTGPADMLRSVRAEMTRETMIALAVVLFLSLIIFLISGKLSRQKITRRQIWFGIAGIISLFLASMVIAVTPGDLSSGYPVDTRPRVIALFDEFSRNPVTELFRKSEKPDLSFETHNDSAPLPARFDTTTRDRPAPLIKPQRPGKPKNLILYLFESTAASYLNLHTDGKKIMPVMNRLRSNSLFFENHYSNFPLSANALYTILTSTYETCGDKTILEHFHDVPRVTLSEILKSRGYRTMLIHSGSLDYADQERYLSKKGFDRIVQFRELCHMPPFNDRVGWGLDERVMLKPILEFIGEAPDRPYLVIIMPVNPHHPYDVPDEEFMIAGKVTESLLSLDIRKKLGIVPADTQEEENPDPEELKRLHGEKTWKKYQNSLHFADYALGYIIDGLESRGHLDDAALFILADHGEAFYQHSGNFNHPFYLFEENVHVPFMIYSKKLFPKPAVYQGITRHIDIMPTALDLLGFRFAAEPEGISVFSPHTPQLALLHTSWKDDYLAVRDGKWKYIRRSSDASEELYDIPADPEEKKNLAMTNQIITSRYRDLVLSARRYKQSFYSRLLKKEKTRQ